MSEVNENELASLLLVDDDQTYCRVLCKALSRRGFEVYVAHNVNDGKLLAKKTQPEFAIVDLNMPGDSGLVLIKALRDMDYPGIDRIRQCCNRCGSN
jgi:two-component system response regulator RegA